MDIGIFFKTVGFLLSAGENLETFLAYCYTSLNIKNNDIVT